MVLSIGYAKTGLGRRIALGLVKLLGRRTLGLGYAIALADLALAPGTPSNTARSAGTIFPVVRGIPGLYGSEPGATARRIGSYVLWTAFASTAVTSSMFLTALAPNAAALALVKQATGLEITWTQWLLGVWPIAVPLLALVPLLVYVVYPPGIRSSPEVPAWAAQELGGMGPLGRHEIAMAAVVALAIVLWIVGANRDIALPLVGSQFIDATGVVLLANVLMLGSGVVEWDDILGSKGAWNVLVWFATLVALAEGLNRVGFVGWAAKASPRGSSAFPPCRARDPGRVLLPRALHVREPDRPRRSGAARRARDGDGGAGTARGPFALLLVYSLGLMGVLSPYATGPAPVYYASGFISRRAFWSLGLLFGLLYLATLLAVGIPYLTAQG